MQFIFLFLLLFFINIAFTCEKRTNDITEVDDSSLLSCLCCKSAQKSLCENGHGTIVAYFKYIDGSGYEAAKISSGFMDSSGAVIMSAHGISCVLHGLVDDEKLHTEKEDFLNKYEHFCFKADFFSRNGECYALENFYIHPEYFKRESDYTNSDIAVSVCSSTGDAFQCDTRFFITPDLDKGLQLASEEEGMEIDGHLFSYHYYPEHESAILKRELQQLAGKCIVSKDTTEIKMDTKPGMSGSNVIVLNNEVHALLAVHRGTTLENSHKAVTLNDNNQTQLKCGYHNLIKQAIWAEIQDNLGNASTINNSDPWRPVLFSMQTDDDGYLQQLFLHELRRELLTQLSIAKKIYSEEIEKIFNFFAFNGHAKNIFCSVFSELNTAIESRSHPGTDKLKNQEIQENGASVFNQSTSIDVTNMGIKWAQLYDPDSSMLICSLGVSYDTPIEHNAILEYIKEEGDIYRRINYLLLGSENFEKHLSKIKNEAKDLAALLILNLFQEDSTYRNPEESLTHGNKTDPNKKAVQYTRKDDAGNSNI
ncbi:MAG: hypothetical protein Q8S21_05775 [Candidatus Paracaedibacteraceae bacterium]|nr:hypothetical protein [Candidatus Paracaedibacteraceae bacterium]